ncbi:hypothetical protein ACWOAN_02575 [Lactococcus taiwanensis]|jgi:uncharacterized protein (DUF885 family)|uniref:hypothetical protein n=1 Tax=Lactococcus taiwanensis TaxID=1151742 RepID=UPI001907403F|nr:hypothetical protein [Lactococcus taiwanensis]
MLKGKTTITRDNLETIMSISNEKFAEIERQMMDLVIDSYLKGTKLQVTSNERKVSVVLFQGKNEQLHLFIDDIHKITVEILKGKAQFNVIKQVSKEDIAYITAFAKCLGIPEQRALNGLSPFIFD